MGFRLIISKITAHKSILEINLDKYMLHLYKNFQISYNIRKQNVENVR